MSSAQPHSLTGSTGAALELSNLDDAWHRWEALVDANPAALLYHRPRWLELLRRAYGFEFTVALMHLRSQIPAGCVLALSKNPFARRLVAMPFSDQCAPLAQDRGTAQLLIAMLAGDPRVHSCEIRGVAAPSPWRTLGSFQNWELNVSPPASRLRERLAINFRRNLSRARNFAASVERGSDASFLSRFYVIHCESRRRQGVPVQPASFFELLRDIFAPAGDFDVWIVSRDKNDLAAAVTIRDRDRVYYKWSARTSADSAGAGHMLVWSIVEAIATRAQVLDLGRADVRNHGLNRFKRELGAVASPLPYSYFPHAPRTISAEVPSGWHALAAKLWRRMPPRICQAIGSYIYRYLS